ncbi:MAG: hypothetical protein V4695_00590 [Pseudomonadota bacterium]
MKTSAAGTGRTGLAAVDKRPFFEKALKYAADHALIDAARRETMVIDAAKGTVQVADYFGTSHLLAGLDSARKRIVTLVSLYLEYHYGADLTQAAQSLRDNSFLSHSRGGNKLLKTLHALPESSMFDGGGQSLKDFQDERTLAKPISCAAYRKEFDRRRANANSMAAARWFARGMSVPTVALESIDADAVIRTALLNRLEGSSGWPGLQEFAQRITVLHKRISKKSPDACKFPEALLVDVPEQHRAVAASIGRDIATQDLPYLADPKLALDAMVHMLEPRYFLRETGLEDIDEHDAIVSREWQQLTRGKEDPYSRLTLFVCLAAGIKPKTTLSLTEARALIRRVRQSGFDYTAVPMLINTSAPYSIRAALLTMWEDEFFPEAQTRLLDEADPKLTFALQFLSENCNIGKK